MTTKVTKVTEHDTKSLLNGIESVITKLSNKMTLTYDGEKVLKFKGDIQTIIKNNDLSIKVDRLGIRDRKRLKRYINRCLCKDSLKSYNIFLHLITSSILQIKECVKVYSPKHKTIQNKRKEWLELQAKADKLLKSYKSEKADFYKVTSKI